MDRKRPQGCPSHQLVTQDVHMGRWAQVGIETGNEIVPGCNLRNYTKLFSTLLHRLANQRCNNVNCVNINPMYGCIKCGVTRFCRRCSRKQSPSMILHERLCRRCRLLPTF